jgi:hypothetical protein
MAVVARLLRGEPLELVARETNVSIARLTEWRERALAGAATALKERERDDEIARLKSKVGEITIANKSAAVSAAPADDFRVGVFHCDEDIGPAFPDGDRLRHVCSCVLDVGVLAEARGLFRPLQHPIHLGEVEVTEQW